MSRIVRSSKFRHVFGTVAKKEDCYDDLRATRNAWDSNYVAVNPSFVAVLYEAGGGGAFAVIPMGMKGKIDPKLPLVTGHKSPVLDIDWNPFNDNLIASVSEDCTGKVWGIPEGGLTTNINDPLQTLSGHKRKVGTVKFSPTANNILVTSAGDFSVKIWDIEKGKDVLSIDGQHADLISATEWNANGSLIATSSKDKKVRVIDPRNKSVAQEGEAHQGVKPSRIIWMKDRLLSVGFSKQSEREYCLWDSRDLSKPLSRTGVDSSSGILMPFYDSDLNIVYMAGKGDGNIRYFEFQDDQLFYLAEFKSATPQRGLGMMPKRGVNVSTCEIDLFFKLGVKLLEPISFQVPRKADVFADDIYPDTASGEPALTSEEWLSGKDAEPKLRSLAPGFVQKKTVVEFNPEKVEAPKELSEKELKAEVERLTTRVAYLEAELIKRDSKIKELSA
eukprot:TRINITY_DN597_c0_g1_i1.p1 TRINITY_DN597_c0_g1~~TRINITY_DN597_c0_g1_i1.p1  ORF type:complete len:461 (-),score=136.66 TRINITY_DN597_c0_g1_i1:87-1424(-)